MMEFIQNIFRLHFAYKQLLGRATLYVCFIDSYKLNNLNISFMNTLTAQSFSKLQELNRQACLCIDEQDYQQAANYLDEAQNILQYEASCGKAIQRTVITTILNNQACLLQKTNDFEQSSNYLQAIINNISDFVENSPTVQLSQSTVDSQTEQYKRFVLYIERKNELALYHLRFCALASHSKNNQIALKSAKKSIQLLKQICHQEYCYEMLLEKGQQKTSEQRKDDRTQDSWSSKIIYKQLARIKDISNHNVPNLFQIYLSKLVLQIPIFQNRIHKNKELHKNVQVLFQSYSIGILMQTYPLPDLLYKPNYLQFANKEFSVTAKLYKVIHMSMAFFTVATQLRLISAAKYVLNQEEKQNSPQWKQSKIYHLLSIMLVVRFFPCQSVFLDHVTYSFQNHYGFNLLQMAQLKTEVDAGSLSIIDRSELENQKDKDSFNDGFQDKNQNQHQYQQLVQLPDQKLQQEAALVVVKNDQQQHMKISQVSEVKPRQKIEFKKIKQIKPKNKIQRLQRTESSKVIEIDKIPIPLSKSKQNKIKNRLSSRANNTFKSSSKDNKLVHKNSERQQKKVIYYQSNCKSRSKSKKVNMLQKSTSKKALQTATVGNEHPNKTKKAKIQQEYGMHQTVRYSFKPAKNKNYHIGNLHKSQQQNNYAIKFNKVAGKQKADIRIFKSPNALKRQSTRKLKSNSKDRNHLQ